MHRSHRLLAYAGVAAAVIAAAFGTWAFLIPAQAPATDRDGLPTGPVTYRFVDSRPEAHLVYPGATVLASTGTTESSDPLEGLKNSAFAGAVLVTRDPPDQVYAWYQKQLSARGWKPYQLAALLSTQVSAAGYRRGVREFFVGAVDDSHMFRVAPGAVPAGGTLFEFTYSIEPASH